MRATLLFALLACTRAYQLPRSRRSLVVPPRRYDLQPRSAPDEATTVRGDIWILGEHRLMCGDSSLPEDMARLESLYEQMQACYRKNDLMAFLELGIEYTKASLAYADNYFIVSAIDDLWPSAKRCAFVAFQEGGNRVIEDNLSHMEQSISAIKDRDEDRLADILHRYALQQCQQVLTAIEKTGSRTA